MIRTAQQWLTCPEFEALSRGNSLAAFATYIEAVQRDAVAAAADKAQWFGDAHPRSIWGTHQEAIAVAIRALIPPKPKEAPEGAMDESGAMDTRGYTTKEVDQIRANAYRAGFTDAREAAAEACARRSNFTARVDVDLIMAACVNDIRALIPAAPDAPPPAPASPASPHRKGGTGPT